MKEKVTAVMLAAGQGRRMGSKMQKQYMGVNGEPLIFCALDASEKSGVDEMMLVVGSGECETCRREIMEQFEFFKVAHIVEGGKECYHPVYEGLKTTFGADYILIHDGVKPCVGGRIIADAMAGAREYGTCMVGMPMRDTIKIADGNEFAKETPDRRGLWVAQAPQTFSYGLIAGVYEKLLGNKKNQVGIADDAMVVESMTTRKVKLIHGSYKNMKVTTPEDIAIAEVLLRGC